ncbi:MAG: hypothetical protein IPM54_01545 [Polyangiaceae bacterium]|nr:hypothetical protein [Polyangiaceae bacterium]
MVFSFISRKKQNVALSAVMLLGILSGCGEESLPPYDVLPLRDALQASPEVMATLPEDSRRTLAVRMEEAERVDAEPVAFKLPDVPTFDNLIAAADALREAEGEDALILGELSTNDGHAQLDARAPSEADVAFAGPLDVRGKANAVAAPFEEAAIRGRAGKTLRGLVSRTQAKSIVRMSGLPVGAIAWDDKVYVNESWLVALSALEDESVVVPLPAVPGDMSPAPPSKPLSVDFSPYAIPDDLNSCASQVRNTCQCGFTSSCSHVPTDQSFGDANAECGWVNLDTSHASAICIIALLSLDAVKECVESAYPPCAAMPVRTRDDAVLFATNDECISIIDSCLQKGEPQVATGSSTDCDDACNDCRYCDNKGNDCQECASDCETAANACEACVEICDALSQNSVRKAEVGAALPLRPAAIHASQCSMRPRRGKSPLPAPMGTALWLFAPVAYLFLRARRRP